MDLSINISDLSYVDKNIDCYILLINRRYKIILIKMMIINVNIDR